MRLRPSALRGNCVGLFLFELIIATLKAKKYGAT
jgi:hypothetical protein